MDGPTLRLLGGFALADAGGRTLVLPGRKARMLLAFVALNATRPVSRERLAGLLWDDGDDQRARHSLRQCLMELRRLGEQAGGDLIHADKDTVALALPVECVDALAVERLAREGTPDALRAAADLCAGMLLPGAETGTEDFDTWLAGERARFARIAAGVFARLTALCEAQGDWDGVASTAERWLTLDPACEEAHRALMRVHITPGGARTPSGSIRPAPRRCAAASMPSRRRRRSSCCTASVTARMPCRGNGDHAMRSRISTSRNCGPCPPSRRWPCCPSARWAGRPKAAGSPTVSPTTSCRGCRGCARCSSSPMARPSASEARQIDPRTVGRALGVRYLVTGSVRTHDGRLRLTVELVEAETETTVWSDVFERRLDDVFAIQDELTTRIVAALETEIEAAEIRRALTRTPASLDAWGAYHRGLWHMFRFTRDDNETARGFFQQALRLDPLCARAHAGLSFTHFQDAFLHRTGDRRRETDRAYRFAEQSVALDERDPTTHWVLGRALWLLERQDDAVEELGLAVDLNPNFALGHYTIAFVQSQGGDTLAALHAVDLAQRLSPIDPLLFGMLGVRALACLNLGDYAQAAVWGERAARRPNAHVHIHAIAAFCDALAERHDEARAYAHRIKETAPSYRCDDFLLAFRTLRPSVADLIRRVGPAIGIPP